MERRIGARRGDIEMHRETGNTYGDLERQKDARRDGEMHRDGETERRKQRHRETGRCTER